jgi:hypothetical protein
LAYSFVLFSSSIPIGGGSGDSASEDCNLTRLAGLTDLT